MSEQENINLVRQSYEAFKRGDLEALLNLYAEDIVWEIPGPSSVPTSGTRRGRDQVKQFFAQLGELLEAQSFEPQEYIAQGNQVVVLGEYTWRVKSTGRTFSSRWAHVSTLGNGKITRLREYTDTAAAAEAFGQ